MAEFVPLWGSRLGYYISPLLFLQGDRVYFDGGSRPATEEELRMPDIYPPESEVNTVQDELAVYLLKQPKKPLVRSR